ncbi:MAG: hypothetical protein GX451_05700 [Acholeplasmataceae bacterium]|nr:hypothetical protein [Acholeplasmataceae bacterium]
MKKFETLPQIIEQLEMLNYQTADGLHKLVDNAAFIQLKNKGEACNLLLSEVIERMKWLSNNYQVLNEQYVISKHVFDAFIQEIEAGHF